MKPAAGAPRAGVESSGALVRIQSNWLSNVIHDLSNPLFAARGYLRLLLEEKNNPLTESQHRWLITALENIDKLTTLTQELNDLPGKNGIVLEVVDVRDLLRQVLDEARTGAPGAAVQFTEHTAGGRFSTIGDPEQLSSALRSFVRTAVEFIGFAGVVDIKAREEEGQILVELRATPGGPGNQKPAPDLSGAFKIWRLHGGSGSVSTIAEGGCVISCELPVVRLEEC
jgi:signal transduction histidine kinase